VEHVGSERYDLPTAKYLFVVSNSSFIKIYDITINEPNLVQVIDFTQVNKELLSYDIYDIKFTKEK
jgi:hypothetical protein